MFIAIPDEISRDYAPSAVKAGAIVIDDSGAWRMDPDVPLVVPEINGADVEQHKGIIAIAELRHDAAWSWPSGRCTRSTR